MSSWLFNNSLSFTQLGSTMSKPAQRFLFASCSLLLILLTACSVFPVGRTVSENDNVERGAAEHGVADKSIVKSANDTRHYRYIKLPNELQVLLVSDAEAEKSAASLDVYVGSRQDPSEFQGLAHFLEHMLFLGTEKYPDAGAYQAFISSHGGSHNAYTSFEHTNYFFDINPEFFDQGLDRFAQFFIAPLFDEEYVEREKNAVHSEYTSKIKDEFRRSVDVFKQLVNPEHPFSKLSVGNLETLAVEGKRQGSLRDQLIQFYQQHYSANLMNLVLVGKEPLDQLEAMARQKFSAVSNSNKQVEPIEEALFTVDQLPKMVKVEPEKSMRMLSIVFPVPDDIDYYQHKPLHYIGNILGHEGQGSLLSYLKSQGWVESLGAGKGLSYKGGATFNLTIQLTDKGVSHHQQVVDAIFQMIDVVRDADVTERRRLFVEQKAISEQQFLYQEKSSAQRYAMTLSSDMQYYPIEDILSGPYKMGHYDNQLVNRYLESLVPNNVLITLTAPEVETDSQTHFYHVDYSASKIHETDVANWLQSEKNSAIFLPQKNLFIAEDLSIVANAEDTVTQPRQLKKTEELSLWFYQDPSFKSPKGSIFFSLRSPVAMNTPEHAAMLNMLAAMASDQLNEFSYAARLAGLNYTISPHKRGLSVKISGFNDKQDKLLAQIIEVLESPEMNSARFENIRLEQLRKLQNRSKQQPYQLAMDAVPDLLYHNSWTDQDLLKVYEQMSLSQLEGYWQRFFSAGHIDLLVHGNYLQQDAQHYARQVSGRLFNKPALPDPLYISQLDESSYSYQIQSDYSDAALALYLQAADLNKSRRAALGVSAQVMRADFYTQLRTEQQLGYIVSSGAYPIQDVPGLYFLVQSPVAGPKELEQAINTFLQQQAENFEQVAEQDFNIQRAAVLSHLKEEPQSLFEQSERYWKDIAQGYYDFDFREQLIAAMEALSFEDWKSYHQQEVLNNPRRLLIYSEGQFSDQAAVTGMPVDNTTSFQSRLGHYTFP